ncbi:peptidylprolyl isomerase [Nocardiopsis lambiniae]|uniref:Peptidyl-prolyl cis-trans isomerase n=1 Tax=Nocardiopsis lambiniae TaxID=3075539 RepID=A0ABU2MFY7_9ACTN|nr:peptidylprolyl isomerase [Nocardiopsis sp. DSM 44743]MDT0331613.1 peptidylprolyl isomerase [Nocardiopsis sp. DSM 44743]
MRLSTLTTTLVTGVLLLTATACGDDGTAADPGATDSAPAPDGAEVPDVDVSDVEGATLHTDRGDITVDLLSDVAPVTVANFVGLAEGAGPANPVTGEPEFYDGTIFHRVIPGFMIQGGDPEGVGTGGPGYRFQDEVGTGETFDEPGVLAMANSGPGTNGSQFFITVEPTPHLEDKHTIFGYVADDASMAVVEEISTVATGPNDKPAEDVVIESVTVHRAG